MNEEFLNLDEFFAGHRLPRRKSCFPDLLNTMLVEREITRGELANRSLVSEGYLYEILTGRKKPSRNKLLCLCVGFGLSLEEAQELLHKGGYEKLFSKRRRDAILCQGIEEGWSVIRINEKLFDEGLKPLC